MFDVNNNERVMELVNGRKSGSYVEPLYVRIYNDVYGMDELDLIEDFNPSAFKVGFGGSIGLFVKKQLNMKDLMALEVIRHWKYYHDELQCDRLYYVFEVSNTDFGFVDNEFYQQLEMYYGMLYEYINNRVQDIRKQRLTQLVLEGGEM
jgi:hypothetical protein